MREIKFRAWNKRFNVMYDWQVILDSLKLERMLDGHPEVKLMQYTGLKDHKGAEIYEGDVVLYTCPENGVTPFRGEVGFFAPEFDISEGYVDDPSIYNTLTHCYINGELKVIGNVYENPELLEAKS